MADGSHCFFRLNDGRGCYGELERVNEHDVEFCYFSDSPESCEFEKLTPESSEASFRFPIAEIDLKTLAYWSEDACMWMHTSWNTENEAWIENESGPGSLPNPESDSALTQSQRRLLLVGYWHSQSEPHYPHPKHLADLKWRTHDRARIVKYLRDGKRGHGWLGYSYCRFGCFGGDPNEAMGRAAQTDGLWVWPEGLAHYIEEHHVQLPDEFLATMEENNWNNPANFLNEPGEIPEHLRSYSWPSWALATIGTRNQT